jgi:hypothetical protein
MINVEQNKILSDNHIRDFLFPRFSKVVLSYYVLLPLTSILQKNCKTVAVKGTVCSEAFLRMYGCLDKNW